VQIRELEAPRAGEIFDTVSFFELCKYVKKDFCGGECVTAGAMAADDRNREVARDGIEPVIQQIRKCAS